MATATEPREMRGEEASIEQGIIRMGYETPWAMWLDIYWKYRHWESVVLDADVTCALL
jgi:hypothetical protein